MFYTNGKLYKYSTSIMNADKPGPNGEKPIKPSLDSYTVRADTLFNVGCIERDPVNGKVKLTTITQCDFKLKVPSFMLTSFLPNAVKGWYEGS